ncbi:MAG TPA: Rieske (2Fe-2S) protein [Planctomycetaceae bacterium]|nr:Rieske (2Fe-2S) protein [Planctomycetaceae bacterium]HQZ65563.1 Rieske (2Fe-2S) protein [Planctomycetaceae bacterium]
MAHDNLDQRRHAEASQPAADGEPRRRFLTTASGSAMAAGLLGAYGTFGYMLGEFVYPASGSVRGWLFVCTTETLAPGEAMDFTSPAGAKVVVARQGAGTSAEDFLALSSVCPHLGCRVHWESQDDRFFCPCHNGAFDREGKPISGPPQAANQSLVRFPLKVENGLLFLEVPLESLASCPAQRANSLRSGSESDDPDTHSSGVA